MSTWEERMSANAKARQVVEEAERFAREAAEQAEADRADEESCRPDFEAGPPCAECYEWARNFYRWEPAQPAWHWVHREIEDGDQTCDHGCHDEPVWCGPMAIA